MFNIFSWLNSLLICVFCWLHLRVICGRNRNLGTRLASLVWQRKAIHDRTVLCPPSWCPSHSTQSWIGGCTRSRSRSRIESFSNWRTVRWNNQSESEGRCRPCRQFPFYFCSERWLIRKWYTLLTGCRCIPSDNSNGIKRPGRWWAGRVFISYRFFAWRYFWWH